MRRIGYAAVRSLPLVLCVALMALSMYTAAPLVRRAHAADAAALVLSLTHPAEALAAASVLQTASTQAKSTVPTIPSFGEREAAAVQTDVIPPKGDGGGAVSEEQLGGGTSVDGTVAVKNVSGVAWDFASLLAAGVPTRDSDETAPQVLIVHTHATESYMPYYAGYYNADDVTRTTDTAANVVAVGEAVAQELRLKGVPTLHDATLHDSPAYTGAYDRSAATIAAYLQQYPSIRVVLDIHRDAVVREDLTKVKPTVSADGQKAAQMMIIVGGVNNAEYENPHCEANLRWGLSLQKMLETTTPGIMRPLYVVNERYNQGLAAGSLLVEMGTDANTLTEALYSGRLLGRALAEVLGQLEGQ